MSQNRKREHSGLIKIIFKVVVVDDDDVYVVYVYIFVFVFVAVVVAVVAVAAAAAVVVVHVLLVLLVVVNQAFLPVLAQYVIYLFFVFKIFFVLYRLAIFDAVDYSAWFLGSLLSTPLYRAFSYEGIIVAR